MKHMKLPHTARALGLALLACLSLSVAAKEPVEKTRVSIAVGGKAAFYYLPLTIAEQLGYFKDEGLDVEISDFAGGAKALQAVVGGSADVVSGAFEHTILMQTKGQSFQAFVLMGRVPQLVLGVAKDKAAKVQSAKDLKGMKIGISAPGSSSQMLVNLVLQKAGVKPSEVSFVSVGASASVVAAVRNGQVDAVSNADPMITMLEQKGDIKVLADTRTLKGSQAVFGGLMPAASLYAPADFVKKYPHTVQALTNAIVRADKWLQTAKPNELIRVVPEAYLLNDKALYLTAFNNLREAYSPDGIIPNESPKVALHALAAFMPDFKPEQIKLDQVYTNRFAIEANRQYK